MVNGLINGLFIAWFLTLFNVDQMFLEVIQPFARVQLTPSHWYVMLGSIGCVAGALGKV